MCIFFLTFHENHECLLHHAERGDQDDYGEDEGADRVGDLVLGLEVDDQRRHEHSRALHKVAQDMDEGRGHVDVGPAPVGVAVGVTRPASMAVTVGLMQSAAHAKKERKTRKCRSGHLFSSLLICNADTKYEKVILYRHISTIFLKGLGKEQKKLLTHMMLKSSPMAEVASM